MRRPLNREGQVWYQQHRQAMQAWMEAGGRDNELLMEASKHLSYLLERCPDSAQEVTDYAMNACLVGRRFATPEAIGRFARIARDALLLDRGSVGRVAFVLLCYAEALFGADRRIDGLEVLGEFERLLPEIREDEPLLEWARSVGANLSGKLWELGLERRRAQRAYQEAMERVLPLIDEPTARDIFSRTWAESLFAWMGDQLPVEQFAAIGEEELERLYVESAVGAVANLGEEADEELRARLAHAACRALEHCGPPPDMSPLVLADVLAPFDAREVDDRSGKLLQSLETRKDEEVSREPPADLTYGPAREVMRRALESRAERIEREWPAWSVAALIGRARSATRAGHLEAAHGLLLEAIRSAIDSRLGLPQAATFGALLAFDVEQGRDATELVKTFVLAYAGTAKDSPAILDSPQTRALLEEPIAAVARCEMELLGASDDPMLRSRASMLIDLMRTPIAPSSHELLATVYAGKEASELAGPAGSDLVGRIGRALDDRPSTAVLVVQSLKAGAAFLVIPTGDSRRFALAGSGYVQALDRLESVAKTPLFASFAGMSSAKGELDATLRAGTAAFEALPEEIREVIVGHDTLLIAPDFRGPQPVLPFELLHDGASFLGMGKDIARFTSLRHLADVLERRPMPVDRARALVTAAPHVSGYAALPAATRECAMVGATLKERDYDAPRIDPTRLSALFLRDRICRVDVLHVAAHGEARADEEWLVLPAGERLTVDDLLSLTPKTLPFVYLSTCNLARTRYLGGGISRGLAYTFADLGAPAVVSNTTPVLDEDTSRLASEFYRSALEAPVGEALRRARIASGVSPATWGRAVLFGDPWHRLPRSDAWSRDQ